jgi:hypothetical protein
MTDQSTLFLVGVVLAGFLAGRALFLSGAFCGKTDFALFFFSLSGFLLLDILDVASPGTSPVPVILFLGTAFCAALDVPKRRERTSSVLSSAERVRLWRILEYGVYENYLRRKAAGRESLKEM